jgi:hypothetical protein
VIELLLVKVPNCHCRPKAGPTRSAFERRKADVQTYKGFAHLAEAAWTAPQRALSQPAMASKKRKLMKSAASIAYAALTQPPGL